jgi:carboxyl-terminal processing protease
MFKKEKLAVLMVLGVFTLGLVLGKGLQSAISAENDTYEDLKVFTEVLSLVQKNYVEDTKSRDLIYGAVRGMLNTLDPHSAFMPPEVYKEVQVDTKGEFGGLGIQIGMKDNKLVVIAPIDGTPAERAGIKAGDWIVKVNDETTKDMSLLDAVQKMRGPRGTKVNLSIRREGVAEPVVYTLVRELIKIESVKSKMLENNIGYVKVTQFQEQTAKDVSLALKKLRDQKMTSLVLDLRNDPGGLLTAAVETSEQFLPSGRLIVSIKSRDGKKDDYVSNAKQSVDNFPMIVLVNEGSASASEIVAGALQDWGRAAVVGTLTFGKGSVQTILPLTDGSGLRLTTAKYYTPKGRSIQNTGITPDIVVKPAGKAQAAGSAMLREQDLDRHLKNETADPGANAPERGAPPQPGDAGLPGEGTPAGDEQDVQLQKAIELLKTWGIFKDLKPVQALSARP